MGGLRWLGKQSAGDRGSSFKHFPVTRALRLDNNVMTGPLMGRGGEVQLMSSQLQVIARPEQVAPVSWLWMKSYFLFFPHFDFAQPSKSFRGIEGSVKNAQPRDLGWRQPCF